MGNDLAAAQIGQARRMENLVQTQVVMQANFAAEEKAKEVERQVDRDGRRRRGDQYYEAADEKYGGRSVIVPGGGGGS